MIVGYDIAYYSYGSGPCVPMTSGYLRVDRFDKTDQEAAARELMRKALWANPRHPRVTSVIINFVTNDDERIELRAGLLNRRIPLTAPMPYNEAGMADLAANMWVGDQEPNGVHGQIGE